MPLSRSQCCQAHARASAVASPPCLRPVRSDQRPAQPGLDVSDEVVEVRPLRKRSPHRYDLHVQESPGRADRVTATGTIRAHRIAAQRGADVRLELRRRLGGGGREPPGRTGAGTGRSSHHVGARWIAGPTASPRCCSKAAPARQDKVAHYLYNCPEYMESMFALFKAGLAPVNTNYRYADDELVYLWDNADAVAVVFHGCFAERCERVRDRVPSVQTWLWVDDGSGPCPEWAIAYEKAAASADRADRARARAGRRRSPAALHRAAPPACRRA